MNNQLCKDNIICCDDNCQRCANLIYNKYVELQEENKKLKQEYKPVRHGEWIHKNGEMCCSVCGGEALMDEVYYQSPYCPECGAKMNGGKKE